MKKIKDYIKAWNFTRYFSFGLGLAVGISYFYNHETSYLFLSVFLLAQSIFGIGCMGGSCATGPTNTKPTIETDEYKPKEKN